MTYDPSKKELYTALRTRSSGVDISDPSILELWSTIKQEENPDNWLLINVTSDNAAKIFSSGKGLNAFVSALSDEEMLFGVFRCLVRGNVKFYQVILIVVCCLLTCQAVVADDVASLYIRRFISLEQTCPALGVAKARCTKIQSSTYSSHMDKSCAKMEQSKQMLNT